MRGRGKGRRPARRPWTGPGGGQSARRSRPDRREPWSPETSDFLFIERALASDPVAVEVDRPQAFRPRVVGFWRGQEFYQVLRVVTSRWEYDAAYHRVLTDRGAFDLRHVRRMDPVTLRVHRRWEVCAELDVVPVARLP